MPVARSAAARRTTYDVVGPVCESGDWIGRDRALAVQPGDLLAVLSAGAYCMSMASNYNTRGRAAEVLVDGDAGHLIRERETLADQMRERAAAAAGAALRQLRGAGRCGAAASCSTNCHTRQPSSTREDRGVDRHLGEVVLAGAHPEEVQDAPAPAIT